MKHASIILISVLLLALVACKTNFTLELKQRLDADTVDIRQVQFYNSKKILLYRVIEPGEADVEGGTIKLRNGKHILLVKVKRMTPGMAVQDFGKTIKVAFGEKDSAALSFTPVEGEEPGYQISAESWDENNQGQITYDQATYYILTGGHAKLLVKKKQQLGAKIEKEVVKGRRVN